MASKRASSGGKAEAAGGNYETLVAAWYCTRVLLGRAAHPLFELRATTRLLTVRCQTAEPVDDVNAGTSDTGTIFVQAKRSLSLSDRANSEFAKVIDQFVRQQKAGADASPAAGQARRLDLARDRLVLATRSVTSRNIVEILPRMLRGLRDRSELNLLTEVQTSKQELEVAKAVETNVRRSWEAAYGREPVSADIGSLLRLVWVQELNVEEGESDRVAALDALRANVLADPVQADNAFSELVKHCARLRAERSGGDQSTLQVALDRAGVKLVALPDYRGDIEALRAWTKRRLQKTPRFTRLLEKSPLSTIDRSLWPVLRDASHAQSFLLVGEPGAGKSGLTYRLAASLEADSADVIFIPVDLLNVESLKALEEELGISRPLADVLQNWPGSGTGILFVDALDAARKFETQTVLREAIDHVLRVARGKWNVVASVRKYDLRQGTEWRRMFQGLPVDSGYSDPEFPHVRHLSVARLTDPELAQTTAFSSKLHALFTGANPRLRALLRNIFNLHLLADLIDQGVISSDLAAIRTQSELLEVYWQHRVRREDGRHDDREGAIRAVVLRMIAAKSLWIFRADVYDTVEASAIVDLEQNDVLRADEHERGVNEDVLLFSHNVLFDYSVARLLFRRGRDPSALLSLLRIDRAMTLMVRPSLTIALDDAWHAAASRKAFWDLAFALSREPALPEAARLAGPMVAAELAEVLHDFDPLLSTLRQPGADRAAAEKTMQYLIGALLVRVNAGAILTGPDAGPWADLIRALAELASDAAMFGIRILLHHATQNSSKFTAAQLAAVGEASRRLLEFALTRSPRASILVITAITAVSRTIASDVPASSKLLRRLIEPAHLSQFGYEELRWLAAEVTLLARSDTDLVCDIYQAAYSYADEQSETKTQMGSSGILPLTSNRRQDYRGAWYLFAENASSLLKQHPLEATRSIARALLGFVRREHPPRSGKVPTGTAFEFHGTTAHYFPDESHYWYRVSFRPHEDGPALLGKFDDWLRSLALEPHATTVFKGILDVIASEAGLAVMWGSALVAGTEHPVQFASAVAPLASIQPVLTGPETRHQVGLFLRAAYAALDAPERKVIEGAVLALTDVRAKEILAGCIPDGLAVTSEMKEFQSRLKADPSAPTNTPACQVTSTRRMFGTDAYLKSEGVTTDSPAAFKLRAAMRPVEELPADVQGPAITIDIARARLDPINKLRAALDQTPLDSVDPRLYELAVGHLAQAAERTALAAPEVLADTEVRRDLMSALLLAAGSEFPRFDAEHEADFHENPSWGGPSARTSAAGGLICLIWRETTPDNAALEAIRKLARDPVCHVRLQIIQRLYLLRKFDPEWMWQELEHVIANEPTRGVVHGALDAAGSLPWVDTPRVIAISKTVLSRYAEQSGPGIEACSTIASTLIANIHMGSDNEDARRFVEGVLGRFIPNLRLVISWITGFSDGLLLGKPGDPLDKGHAVRARAFELYKTALDAALAEIESLSVALDIRKFGTWPACEQEKLKELFRALDEITMRLYFASGADSPSDGTSLTPAERTRFYGEARPLLERLSDVAVVHVAHYLIQTLESFIPVDPSGAFALIARSVRASEKGGYTFESMGADVIVRIVERYLADHRNVFADQARLNDLMDCLDAFVRAGWPAAHALTYRLGEIWR